MGLRLSGPGSNAFGSKAASLRPKLRVPRRTQDIITAFVSGHGWTGNGVGTINLNDTSDAALGNQHVSITTGGGGNAGGSRSEISKTGIGPIDLTKKALRLWLKVDDYTNLEQVRILAGTDSVNCYVMTAAFGTSLGVNNLITAGQWGTVTVDASIASTVGTPDKTNITYLNVRVTDNGGGTSAKATVHVGGLAVANKPAAAFPNGLVTFGFDDGYADQYTIARPILDKYGYGATAYVIGDLIAASAGTYMSLTQLKNLEDLSGWEVAAHSHTVADHNLSGGLTALTPTQLRANLEAHKEWLLSNGFRGADHFAWPQGYWNDTNVAISKDYFSTVRTTGAGFEQLPPGERLKMRVQAINAGTSLGTLTALVDKAYSEGSWLIFYTHRVLDSGAAGTQIDTTTFTGLVDYINTKGVPVATMTEAMDRLAVEPKAIPKRESTPLESLYKGWAMDPAYGTAGTSIQTGAAPILSQIVVQDPGPLNNLIALVGSAAVTPTAGQCFAALYDSAGNRLGVSADIGSQTTSTGLKTFAMTSATRYVQAGEIVYGLLLTNAATHPGWGRASMSSVVLAALKPRFTAMAGGATAAPASITPSALLAQGSAAYWMAVS